MNATPVTLFSDIELLALKAFYEGMQARSIKQKYCDPWPAVARHRSLNKDQYRELLAKLDEMRLD